MATENLTVKMSAATAAERLPVPRRERVGDATTSRPATVDAMPPKTFASRALIFVLGAAMVLSALAYGAVNSWALAIFQAFACAVVLLWAWDAFSSGALRVNRSLLQLPLVALVAIGVVQLLPLGAGGEPLSLDPFQTRLVTIKVAALLIYFAAALAFVDRPERLHTVVRLVVVFGVLLAMIGLIQSFLSPEKIYGIREPKGAYPFGPFVNRHHFANYMLMALALPLGLLFAGAVERERQLLAVFAVLVMGVALVATGSRGAIVGLVGQVVFLVIAAGVAGRKSKRRREVLDDVADEDESIAVANGADEDDPEARGGRVNNINSRSSRGSRNSRGGEQGETTSLLRQAWTRATWLRSAGAKRAAAAGALFVLLFVGVLTFGGEAGLTRLVGTINSADPTTGRTHIWSVTLDIIREHPLLGAGLGAYSLAYTRHDTRGGAWRVEAAHNDYLQILADTGILGACFAVLFFVVLYRVGWRRLRSVDKYRRGVALGALAACTAALVHSFFEFSLHTTSNALLFLVMCALATLGAQVERPPKPSKRRKRRRSNARVEGLTHADIRSTETAENVEAVNGVGATT